MPTDMYCIDCKYHLKGLTEDRCPECGREFNPDNQFSYLQTAWAHRPINIAIGAVLMILIIGWVLVGSGDVAMFIDFNSLILVLGMTAAGLWLCFGPLTALMAIKKALLGARSFNLGEFSLGIAVLARGYQLAWATGFATTLLGLVIMLQNMDDPAAIGPGMAVSLLPSIYGLLLAEFVFSPLQQAMISRANVPMSSVPWHTVPQRSMLMLCIAGVLLLGTTFLILFMALWPFIETPWPSTP